MVNVKLEDNYLFSLITLFSSLKFHINNPESFPSIIQFLSFMPLNKPGDSQTCHQGKPAQAASAWTAVWETGVSFARLVTRKINAWFSTPVNESSHQRSLEIHKKIKIPARLPELSPSNLQAVLCSNFGFFPKQV